MSPEKTKEKMNGTIPSMHEDFKINTLVDYDLGEKLKGTGKIIGISSRHVIFIYIVLLDAPLNIPGYEDWSAITVSGTHLKERLK